MVRKIIAALGVLILSMGLAQAHGPARLKLVLEQKLDATPAEIWAVIGRFEDMSWHPAVASVDITGDGSVDQPEKSLRVLHLNADGAPTITEMLTKWRPEKLSYSYLIQEVDVKVLPVTNYASTITVKDEGGKATVEWKAGFYRGFPNNDPPAGLNDEAAEAAVTALYQAGFAALVERFGARD
ncbi:MAG: SRPBCC family protein [Paracoccus sp. (in: a-proteobacteria)]|nr:SRPBCC family protein [Paracoccus sp. (in: a-proteobacteria)]